MEFSAILVEGLFYEQEGSLFVEKDDGEHISFEAILAPVVGQRVQLALHHLPPQGIQQNLPGAGSCRYLKGAGCPVRHDLYPDRLLSFHLEGVLCRNPWRLVKFDGMTVPVPVAGMPGHYGRIGAATSIDVEEMRAELASVSPEKLAKIVSSGVDAASLEVLLERLRQVEKK